MTFFKYLAVGAANTAIAYAVFVAALFFFPYLIANSISFVLSLAFHFMANRAVTFVAQTGRLDKQIRRYLCLAAINYSLSMLVIYSGVEIMGLDPRIAVIGSICITIVSGYFLSRFWVFAERRHA